MKVDNRAYVRTVLSHHIDVQGTYKFNPIRVQQFPGLATLEFIDLYAAAGIPFNPAFLSHAAKQENRMTLATKLPHCTPTRFLMAQAISNPTVTMSTLRWLKNDYRVKVGCANEITEAIANDRMDIFKWLIGQGTTPTTSDLNAAYGYARRRFIDLLRQMGVRPDPDSLTAAIQSRQPQLVRELMGEHVQIPFMGMTNAAKVGDPEIFRLIHTHSNTPGMLQALMGSPSKPDSNTLWTTISNANLTLAQTLISEYGAVLRGGHRWNGGNFVTIEIVQFIIARTGIPLRDILYEELIVTAAQQNNWEVVKYLHSLGCVVHPQVWYWVAQHRAPDRAHFLAENMVPLTQQTIADLHTPGFLAALQFLRNFGFTFQLPEWTGNSADLPTELIKDIDGLFDKKNRRDPPSDDPYWRVI
jgi:hypothetical protein